MEKIKVLFICHGKFRNESEDIAIFDGTLRYICDA